MCSTVQSTRTVELPVRHILVTNDFPPKIGGIQSYLWELWRRLPPEDVTVLTTAHEQAQSFDSDQAFRVERVREPVLLPTPILRRRLRRLVTEVDAEAVIIDPALPLGLVGRSLPVPYGLVLHGAEITVPGPPARHPAGVGQGRCGPRHCSSPRAGIPRPKRAGPWATTTTCRRWYGSPRG